MNWKIDDSDLPGFIRVTVEGTLSLERVTALWDEICSHEKWRPGTSVLMDNRKIERIGADGNGLMAGAARYFTDNHDKVGGSQVAVISAHPEHFMHGRQLQYALRSRNSGVNVQIFYDENEALEWLRHMSSGQSRPVN